MTIAISFGLAAALSVVVLGDESGYVTNQIQKMKIAAMFDNNSNISSSTSRH